MHRADRDGLVWRELAESGMTAMETEVAEAAIHSAPAGLIFFPPFCSPRGRPDCAKSGH
jgi:hypothetical protein